MIVRFYMLALEELVSPEFAPPFAQRRLGEAAGVKDELMDRYVVVDKSVHGLP